MIQALPPILFYDDEAEIQVYEDQQPDPIFKINIIKKFAHTKLSRYANSFYQQVYKEFFSHFKVDLDYINSVVLEEEPTPVEPPTYIIDDTEEEEQSPQEEEDEDEESFSFLKFVKGVWKLTKIYRWIKKVRNAWKKFQRARKFIQGKFKRIVRAIRKMRIKFGKVIRRVKRFYKQVLKPWWGRLKRRFWRWCRKMKRILRRQFKKFRKVLRILTKRLKKTLGKIIKKFLKKFAKKALKKLIQLALKWIAGLFTATGVGAVIGAAIFAATIAWEVYDFTHDADTDDPEFTEVQKPHTQPVETKVKEANTLYFKDITIHQINQTHIEKYYETVKDKIVLELVNAKTLPQQIIGRFYNFYLICDEWLQHQQDFVVNILKTFTEQTNQYFDAIVAWADKHKDPHATAFAPKATKDPKKLKKPNWSSLKKIMEVQQIIEKKGVTSFLVRLFSGVDINNNYGDQPAVKFKGKVAKFNQIINPPTPLFDLNETLTKHTNWKKEKRGALGLKNYLLFELYSRLVWVKESVPV